MKIQFDFTWFNEPIEGLTNFSINSDTIPQIGSQFDFEFKDGSGTLSFKIEDLIYSYRELGEDFHHVIVYLKKL